MGEQFINILFPPLFLLLLGKFCYQNKSTNLRLCSLFFTSVACFSQNFSFIFRELHQLIQLGLLFLFVVTIFKNGRGLKVFYLPLCFLAFVITSLVFSTIDADAKGQLINICAVFGVLCFIYLCIKDEKQLIKLLYFIGELAALAAFSGIVEYILGISTRIEGSFANPNYFALFIGVGWAPVYCYFSKTKKYLALPIMTLAIVLSGSRAALIFPILFVLWRIYLQNNILKMFLYGTLTALIFSAVLMSGLTRLSSSETSGSDAERLVFAKIAINMAIDNPFIGVGWGRFISEFSNYSSTVDKIILEGGTVDASKQDRRVTHNDLLRIIAELGFVAFFLVLIFLIKTGWLIYKYKGFGIDSLFPCWCGMLVFSLTHNNLNTAYSWFFLLLPWFIYYNRLRRTQYFVGNKIN
jgi:O-antigen ligase